MKTTLKKSRRNLTLSDWAIEHAERMAEARGVRLSILIELLLRAQYDREQGKEAHAHHGSQPDAR